MKPFVLAAALVALAAPVAFAETAPKHAAPDTAAASAGIPDAVKTYVMRHAGDPFPYSGGVQVGESVRDVDAGEAWRPIPDYPQYSWSNLSGQLVVVDNKASKVVAVY
jgi:hypothetical protein